MENVPEPKQPIRHGSGDISSEVHDKEAYNRVRRISGSSSTYDANGVDSDALAIVPADVRLNKEGSGEFSECEALSTSDFELQASTGIQSHWRGFIHMLAKGPKRLQTFQPLSLPKLTRRKSRNSRHSMIPAIPPIDNSDMCFFKPHWKNFSVEELIDATNDFSQENLIGEGGYAEVYKGVLPDGHFVAVKRLGKGNPEEMAADFLSELGIIVHVNHPNIAKVVGYGVEGGMHLVLDLSPNGSLEGVLKGERTKLQWDIRFKIALGSAEGLHYLHEGCQRRIIHRDIKSANILLTEDFEAQISDFGLAKWLPDQWTHHTVAKIEGTFGYLPPEFFLHGIVDEKTDVFAYGVLILELITGRLALDDAQKSLVMWAKPHLDRNDIKKIVDPLLGDAYDKEQMNLVAMVANMCIHQSSSERPKMQEVVQMLKGESTETQKASMTRSYSLEIIDAEEDNNTASYLNAEEYNHLMQVALGL